MVYIHGSHIRDDTISNVTIRYPIIELVIITDGGSTIILRCSKDKISPLSDKLQKAIKKFTEINGLNTKEKEKYYNRAFKIE